jgi:hypothetical protein
MFWTYTTLLVLLVRIIGNWFVWGILEGAKAWAVPALMDKSIRGVVLTMMYVACLLIFCILDEIVAVFVVGGGRERGIGRKTKCQWLR